MGNGWTHNYNVSVKFTPGPDSLLVTRGTRTDHYHPVGSGRFSNATGFYNDAFEMPDGTIEVHWPNQTVEIFGTGGALTEIRNKSGQRIRFIYSSSGRLETVLTALGRTITWAYDASGLLTSVTDFTGRSVKLDHDSEGNLTALTGPAVTGTPTGNDFPLGKTMRFEYFGGSEPKLRSNLIRIFAPNESAGGPPKIQVAYETNSSSASFDRVTSLAVGGTNVNGIPAGGTITYSYEDLAVASPDTNTPVFRTSVADRHGNGTVYSMNPLGNALERREFTKGLRPGEPPFFATAAQYNADGEMVQLQLPEGNLHLWTFDTGNPDRAAQGNALEHTRIPDARGGDQAFLKLQWRYEPIFQQPALYIEERGFATRLRYDYQEGTNTAALANVRRLPIAFIEARLAALAAEVPMGLGDVNGDGLTTQLSGNAVKKIYPSPTLPDATTQTITEEYEWNEFGQCVAETDGEGNIDFYIYNPASDPDGDGLNVNPLVEATGLGYLRLIIYDATTTSKRTETAPPVAIQNEFFYDAVGNRIGDRDGRGNIKTQDVNALNQVVRTVSEAPFLYEVRSIYDANNNVVERRIQNKDGENAIGTPAFFVHKHKYDILDHQIEEHLDATGSTPDHLITKTRYDANENPTLTIQPEQNQVVRVFDERDFVFIRTRGADSPDAATWTFNYDSNRNLIERIDAEDTDGSGGREKWKTSLDGFDRPVQAIDALNDVTATTYDPASNATIIKHFGHPAGSGSNVLLAETRQKFDSLSRMFERGRKIFANSGGTPSGPVALTDGPVGDPGFAAMQSFFDRNSRPFKSKDEEGDTTQMFFDGADRMVRIVDPVGNEFQKEYDGNNNPVKRTEIELQPEGLTGPQTFVSGMNYDELDRLIEFQDPLKHTRRTKYDSRSNVALASDAKDGGTSDGAVNAPGNTIVYVYDGSNRRLATHRHLRVGGVGGAGLDTSNPFNPDGVVSTFQSWDGNSRLTTQTDDNGNTTAYLYNQRDMKVTDHFADGKSITYALDLDNNIKTTTDQNGSVFTCSYDALNRLTACSIQRGPGIVGTTQQTWKYDGLSRLRGCTDNNDPTDPTDDAAYVRVVDSLDRTIEERFNGRLTDSSWFGENRRTGLRYPGGRQIAFGFDSLDRVKSVTDGTPMASYNYIGPSRVLRRTYGNGTKLNIGYDGDRRLTSCVHSNAANQLLVGFTYTWDREHNRTSEFRLHEGDGDTVAYDSLYRVVAAGFDQSDIANGATAKSAAFYTLDGVHNWREFLREKEGNTLFTSTNTVSPLNEYVSFANTQEEHDSNGNLTKQTIFKENGQTDAIRRFFWDAHNRLALVTEKEGTSPERAIASYAYFADNRRTLKRVVTSSGRGQPHVDETRFFYDGWRTIEDQNAFGQTDATYIDGPMYIDEHVAMDRRQGNSGVFQRLYYHANSLFSVHGLTNANGQLVETVRYDLYGQPFINHQEVDFKKQAVDDKQVMASPHGNPYLFTGHRFDDETGLFWMRNRYYVADSGRFASRDPVLAGYNLYLYALNSPLTRVDPHGLQALGKHCPPWTEPCPKPGHEPSADGCGSAEFDANDMPVQGYDFGPACDKHDICYETCEKPKWKCDEELLKDLLSVCRTVMCAQPSEVAACEKAARSYAGTAMLLGGPAYNRGQEAACNCCCVWRLVPGDPGFVPPIPPDVG